MIEALGGGGPMCAAPHITSCAERTDVIGRKRAVLVRRCRLRHLTRARQSLLRQRSQAWAGWVALLSGHSRLWRDNTDIGLAGARPQRDDGHRSSAASEC